MIESIRLLDNIGTFDSGNSAASISLKRLTLIYAENGSGKTTLTSVLRSLATGNKDLIVERRRLGSTSKPKVVLKCKDPNTVHVFEKGTWNRKLPELRVFDEVFVDENVYSGLNVEAQHKKNLHEFVIGERGVALSHKRRELVERVRQHNEEIRVKKAAIDQSKDSGLDLERFLALPPLANIDERIRSVESDLNAADKKSQMLSAPEFQPIRLPDFDKDVIEQILATSLSDIDSAAESQVLGHAEALGEGGGAWVEDGYTRMVASDEGTCPYCGQNIDGLALIAQYRAFFSEGYKQLKKKLVSTAAEIERRHGGRVRVDFMSAVAKANETRQFWKDFLEMPEFEIDAEVIARSWESARDSVLHLFQLKRAAPLDQIVIDGDSMELLETHERHRREIVALNKKLLDINNDIENRKRTAESIDIEGLRLELADLKATRERFSEGMNARCEELIEEHGSKQKTEEDRERATKALEDFRTDVFPNIEEGVNQFLSKFNARFVISDLEPSNRGSGTGSSSDYDLVINGSPIPKGSTKNIDGEHSFRNLLSAGDRNTLALALFFSSLQNDPNLANSIVVIDDPLSSLDDHRSHASAVAIRRLSTQAKQVIVLSHNKDFLCHVWDRADQNDYCSLELVNNGGKSTLQNWQVTDEKYSENDNRLKMLEGYAENKSGNELWIAALLRDQLEHYLRATCGIKFRPGHPLRDFLNNCRMKVGRPTEVVGEQLIEEIDEIVEYSERYHHSKGPAYETKQINSEELLSYVEMTLEIVKPRNLNRVDH